MKFLIETIIAVEDRRFFNHFGIDIISIIRAAIANILSLKIKQGGSTITQQLARAIYLKNEKRSWWKKIKEIAIALRLERKYTKGEILYLYIHNVYMGGDLRGFFEASRFYFGKDLYRLSEYEVIVLVAMLKGPNSYGQFDVDGIKRQLLILSTMAHSGKMSHAAILKVAKKIGEVL